MKKILVLALSLCAIPYAFANNIYVSNTTDTPLAFNVNGECLANKLKPNTMKFWSDAQFRAACDNKSKCFIEVHKDGCDNQPFAWIDTSRYGKSWTITTHNEGVSVDAKEAGNNTYFFFTKS